MRVMTFNLRADNVLDVRNRWEKRSHLVYEVIKKCGCDVIGLQEVTNKMYADLCSNVKGYNIMGVGRTKKFFNERNNILVCDSYKILDNKTFWLSKTPERRGSSVWYSLFPRICTTSVIELDHGPKIRVYNTHLDCLLPYAREYGLKTIINYMDRYYEEEQLPCLLMGDFNATPNSKLIKQLGDGIYSSRRFIAVQDTKKEIYNETTMGMFKGKEKGMHIDYIFVSEEFKIEDVEIVKYNQNGKYPSDHYPIVAEIKI